MNEAVSDVMNLNRRYLRGVTDADLAIMWDEIDAWERDGHLPIDARVRDATRAALDYEKGDDVFADFDDPGMRGLIVQNLAYEVWRETARRAQGRT